MKALIDEVIVSDGFQKPKLLQQVLPFIGGLEAPGENVLIERSAPMEKQREIADALRSCPVEEVGQAGGVLFAPAGSADTGHDMRVITDPGGMQPLDRLFCLPEGVPLLHLLQHILQTAFDPEIQVGDQMLMKGGKVCVCFLKDIANGCVHGDAFTSGKGLPDPVQNLEQAVGGQTESAAVTEKNPLRVSADPRDTVDLRTDLLQREKAVSQMLEQHAEPAAVVRTADRDRKHETAPFHRAAANLSFIIHVHHLNVEWVGPAERHPAGRV